MRLFEIHYQDPYDLLPDSEIIEAEDPVDAQEIFLGERDGVDILKVIDITGEEEEEDAQPEQYD